MEMIKQQLAMTWWKMHKITSYLKMTALSKTEHPQNRGLLQHRVPRLGQTELTEDGRKQRNLLLTSG